MNNNSSNNAGSLNNNSGVRQRLVHLDDSDMSTVQGDNQSRIDPNTPREKEDIIYGGYTERTADGGGSCSCGHNCCLCCDCCTKWRTLVLLGGFVFLQALPGIAVSPILPKMKKDYFGSDAKAAMFQSLSDGSMALINTLLCGAYAQLLDTMGRKPFFIAQAVFTFVIQGVILAFQDFAPAFIIVGSLSRIVQSSCLLAWIADRYSPEDRPRAFAIVQATGIACAIPALAITVANPPKPILFGAGMAIAFASVLYAIFLIPESLPKSMRKPWKDFTLKTISNPFGTLKYICVSRCVGAMVAIVALAATAQIGTQEVTIYWVDSRVGWGPIDIAIQLLETGIIVPIGMLWGMPLALKYLSPIMILFVAIVGLAASIVLVATIWAKWVMFALVVPLLIVEVWAVPIIYSMMANAGRPQEQAKRMTAMQVVIDLCSAVGPLIFGVASGTLKGPWKVAPFAFCFLLCVLSGFLTAKLAKWYEIDMKDGLATKMHHDDDEDDNAQQAPRQDAILNEERQSLMGNQQQSYDTEEEVRGAA